MGRERAFHAVDALLRGIEFALLQLAFAFEQNLFVTSVLLQGQQAFQSAGVGGVQAQGAFVGGAGFGELAIGAQGIGLRQELAHVFVALGQVVDLVVGGAGDFLAARPRDCTPSSGWSIAIWALPLVLW